MSNKIKVAILGLGAVGEIFSENFLDKIQRQHINVEIVAVATRHPDSPVALGFAHSHVPVFDNALKVIELGEKVDIIFDLTGNTELRKELRNRLQATNNRHTVIAPEVFAHLLWNFFGESVDLPQSKQTGY